MFCSWESGGLHGPKSRLKVRFFVFCWKLRKKINNSSGAMAADETGIYPLKPGRKQKNMGNSGILTTALEK